MRRASLSWIFIMVLLAGPAAAGTCPAPDGQRPRSATARRDCPPPRIEPYDPDRVRAGRTPGFIDLGNGTEVRVGGRVRMDHDMRR